MKRIISLNFLFGSKAKAPVDAELVVSVCTDDLLTIIDVDCKFVAEFDAARYSGVKKAKAKLASIVAFDGVSIDLTILESERKALAAMCNNYCVQIAMECERFPDYMKALLAMRYDNATKTFLKLT